MSAVLSTPRHAWSRMNLSRRTRTRRSWTRIRRTSSTAAACAPAGHQSALKARSLPSVGRAGPTRAGQIPRTNAPARPTALAARTARPSGPSVRRRRTPRDRPRQRPRRPRRSGPSRCSISAASSASTRTTSRSTKSSSSSWATSSTVRSASSRSSTVSSRSSQGIASSSRTSTPFSPPVTRSRSPRKRQGRPAHRAARLPCCLQMTDEYDCWGGQARWLSLCCATSGSRRARVRLCRAPGQPRFSFSSCLLFSLSLARARGRRLRRLRR
mmetsp:Transcript_18852/g.60183  ORF Transcript_18852/g.60183 Transcript_18852/m.60183 type:complete len:270 (-) Transcript_18852:170-979(-)